MAANVGLLDVNLPEPMQRELGLYRDDPRALGELLKYHDLQHRQPQVEHQRQRSLDFDY